MHYQSLVENIKRKKSFLCVGLDTDIHRIPKIIKDLEYPIFEFNKEIIDATHPYAVAYKPNLAFYEMLGAAGWISLELTINYLKENYPDIFVIADAKRGDIGNTSKMYAHTFFGNLDCDAITLAPYMGKDTFTPFLSYDEKWVIILSLTSNDGAADFQYKKIEGTGRMLFEEVIMKTREWGNENNMMYVVGATKADMLKKIREIVPNYFLLVPGVGAQGGSLAEVAQHGMNGNCGLLVNSSRSIIYADGTERFAKEAGNRAAEIQAEMEQLLKQYRVI
jgi:orotidine-5'-phosphate decarboxylase